MLIVFRGIIFLFLLSIPAFAQDWAAKGDDGSSKFEIAIREGKVENVKDYLSNGAPISFRDVAGRTPLHNVGHSGNKEVLKVLAGYSPDVSARDFLGWTPLMVAMVSQDADLEFIRILINLGCRLSDSEDKVLCSHITQFPEKKRIDYFYKKRDFVVTNSKKLR